MVQTADSSPLRWAEKQYIHLEATFTNLVFSELVIDCLSQWCIATSLIPQKHRINNHVVLG